MSAVGQSAMARGAGRARWGGRLLTTLAAILGIGLAVAVVRAAGARHVGALLLGAGVWMPVVMLLHTPQTLCSALGWGRLLPRARRPSPGRLYLFRWVRESVNSLLPVAQVGGDFVRARLLARTGVPVGAAAASCALDVTLELAAQAVFTGLGLAALAAMAPSGPVLRLAVCAALGLAVVVAGLFAAQRLARVEAVRGAIRRVADRLIRRFGRAGARADAPGPSFRPYRRDQAAGFGWHLLSWLLGGIETWAALRAVGLVASVREAAVIESLSQAVRTAAFAVPGALGVQEGGLILICGLFGVSPARAVALSLVRRLRELALGAPGLLAWRMAEHSS